MKSKHILVTKNLTLAQQKQLSDSGVGVKMYNAISIKPLPFESSNFVDSAIVTSQNTALILFNSKITIKQVFCVGSKTEKILVENGYHVVKKTENGKELANYIAKNYKTTSFVFFCGKKRRDEIPKTLSESAINFKEISLYNTELNIQKFNQNFDGILFFSPSAIQSYIAQNSLTKTIAFCIGNTTANEARKHTSNVVVAPKATVESTIATLISFFRS